MNQQILTPAQLKVLEALSVSDGQLSIREIAKRTGLSQREARTALYGVTNCWGCGDVIGKSDNHHPDPLCDWCYQSMVVEDATRLKMGLEAMTEDEYQEWLGDFQ